MIKRHLAEKLLSGLRNFPAVAILGSRQVGKTTLAKDIAHKHTEKHPVLLDLEKRSHLAQLRVPEEFFRLHDKELVVLDEVQRLPEIFPELRATIDERRQAGRVNGQFLLLGSSSLTLMQQSSESLAGRILYLHLGGFTELEVAPKGSEGQAARDHLWMRGGYPDSFLARNDEVSTQWRESFISTYIERDIPTFGVRLPAETMTRLWIMLAHNNGTLLNAERIAASLGVSGVTVRRYIDLLADLFLVRILPPWHANIGKRLVKSPKVYIRDTGIVHTLLDIPDMKKLLAHPIAGASWESYVIEQICTTRGSERGVSFYRTARGAEIDLILEHAEHGVIAVEIKRTMTPKLSPGFLSGVKDVDAKKRFFIYPGQARFPLGQDTEAISLSEFLDVYAQI